MYIIYGDDLCDNVRPWKKQKKCYLWKKLKKNLK